MHVYRREEFRGFVDADSNSHFSDIEFIECTFVGGLVSVTHQVASRSLIQRVRVIDCSQVGCGIECAICEDVFVDGLSTHGQPLQCWGAVFRHVTLRGTIEHVTIANRMFPGFGSTKLRQEFEAANAKYYDQVDWALDIRDADFTDFEIRGIPSPLVLRDPGTQVIISRTKALESNWRTLPFKSGVTQIVIEDLISDGSTDCIYVAPKRNARFRDYLADIRLLRTEGIALAD